MTARINWPEVIEQAASIVYSYSTSVTLRQLFYRLMSAQVIPNSQAAYKRLSSLTAEARREGDFPALIDRGRKIHQRIHFRDVSHALRSIIAAYRLDRTGGQDVSLYLGVEKAGMVVQLESWFADLGVPVLALGGYWDTRPHMRRCSPGNGRTWAGCARSPAAAGDRDGRT